MSQNSHYALKEVRADVSSWNQRRRQNQSHLLPNHGQDEFLLQLLQLLG
ncbi:MAG TPA: hypothetical protein V6D09_11245 [Leptolyngbyaceae cyanobacterium]